MRFKNLRGSPEGKAQRGQYVLAVDLAVTLPVNGSSTYVLVNLYVRVYTETCTLALDFLSFVHHILYYFLFQVC